ncbi:MAG: hypothetical protein NTW29_03035 [Bacteroidetes bacterium]|nr:hypothetical protein [Bacteroidota bacterium]
MKALILFIYILVDISAIKSQSKIITQEISLPQAIRSSQKPFEFSSLARWNGNILLIPALKDITKPLEIFLIPENEIAANIKSGASKLTFSTMRFDLDSFKRYVSNILGYDGIEAVTVVGDEIYLSIEVKGEVGAKYCRIAKGVIDTSNNSDKVVIMNGLLDISRNVFGTKDTIGNNSGFESLAYSDREKKLYAFFEDRDNLGRQPYYIIDSGFKKASLNLLNESVEDRLSDVYCVSGKPEIMYGISSRYYKKDYCRSVIVRIDIVNNRMLELGQLCINDCPFNWEGIIAFEEGLLIINDNKNKPDNVQETKLVYCKLPK